jgi:hypothetical protein
MTNIIPSRGRPGVTLIMSVRRQLTESDLIDMATDPAPKVAQPIIQRLRASHHAMARHLAMGKSVKEVALLCSRTPQRVSDLQKDPAFNNLVTYYHEEFTDTVIDQAQTVQETITDIAQMSADAIHDRLEDPEILKTIPIGELRQLMTAAADRTVAPPKQATPLVQPPMQVTFNMGPNNLRPQEKQPIDVTPNDEES